MIYVKMAFHNGATQLSKKAFCLTTLSIMRLSLRAGTRITICVKKPNMAMLSVAMMSVIMLIVIMLIVIVLSVC
jgi:hypothetical protein